MTARSAKAGRPRGLPVGFAPDPRLALSVGKAGRGWAVLREGSVKGVPTNAEPERSSEMPSAGGADVPSWPGVPAVSFPSSESSAAGSASAPVSCASVAPPGRRPLAGRPAASSGLEVAGGGPSQAEPECSSLSSERLEAVVPGDSGAGVSPPPAAVAGPSVPGRCAPENSVSPESLGRPAAGVLAGLGRSPLGGVVCRRDCLACQAVVGLGRVEEPSGDPESSVGR